MNNPVPILPELLADLWGHPLIGLGLGSVLIASLLLLVVWGER